jgi:hypothetical protein
MTFACLGSSTIGEVTSEQCQQCGHPFDPHAIIATTGEHLDGGIVLCPEPGCECFMTWGENGMPPVHVPGPEEIAQLRRTVQYGQGQD